MDNMMFYRGICGWQVSSIIIGKKIGLKENAISSKPIFAYRYKKNSNYLFVKINVISLGV